MSVITTNAQSTAGARVLDLAPEALSRSLGRMAGSLRTTATSNAADTGAADSLQAQCRQAEAGAADLQSGLSQVQAADGFLRGIAATLGRMNELAAAAKQADEAGADTAAYDEEFTALQQQLRETIGGTTAEIGGRDGVADPRGAFAGTPLFGNTPGLALAGADSGDSITIPTVNLRDGALGDLIQQTGAGEFVTTAAGASPAISGALQQVAGHQAALGASAARLQTAAIALQIQGSNIGAAFSPLDNADAAAQATATVQADIVVGSPTALLAHGNLAAGAALKLLNS